jgi:hypothetical protein
VVTEPLPSYQQFLIVGFRGYESCTRCLATAKLEHTYFLRYFGPSGRIPHFSLLILFLTLIQSGKRGKWNYTIHRKIVMPEHTHIHSLLYSLIYIYIYLDPIFMHIALKTQRFFVFARFSSVSYVTKFNPSFRQQGSLQCQSTLMNTNTTDRVWIQFLTSAMKPQFSLNVALVPPVQTVPSKYHGRMIGSVIS